MTAFKRITAAFLVVFLLLALLLPAAYMISTADHCCQGKECGICTCIAVCKKLLQAVSCLLVLFAALFALHERPFHKLCKSKDVFACITPITNKVKLLN